MGNRRRRRGMSLVEIMVVIAIVLTLTAILGAGVMQAWRSARVDITRITLAQEGDAVIGHEVRRRSVPGPGEGMGEIFGAKIPRDAWGTNLGWERPRDTPWDLVSLGEDKTSGGTGFDQDLRYRDR